jgi:hypothetical protein
MAKNGSIFWKRPWRMMSWLHERNDLSNVVDPWATLLPTRFENS